MQVQHCEIESCSDCHPRVFIFINTDTLSKHADYTAWSKPIPYSLHVASNVTHVHRDASLAARAHFGRRYRQIFEFTTERISSLTRAHLDKSLKSLSIPGAGGKTEPGCVSGASALIVHSHSRRVAKETRIGYNCRYGLDWRNVDLGIRLVWTQIWSCREWS